MKLGHKIAKLGNALTYRRTWRRVRRGFHPIRVEKLLERIDRDRLCALQEQFRSRFPDASYGWPDYAKYLDLSANLPLDIRRVQDLSLTGTPPCDILDLGCGDGLFLFVARSQGHRGLGLDTGGVPIFDALAELLGVERTMHQIRAFQSLPDLGRKFDLITAFSTTFHGRREHAWCWGAKEWEFFIGDLERLLRPGGRVFFGLNLSDGVNYYTHEVLDVFTRRGAIVERENVRFSPRAMAGDFHFSAARKGRQTNNL